MDDLVSLVEKASTLRRAAESPSEADYQIRDRLMQTPEFREIHESIGALLRQDSTFVEREGIIALHGAWIRFNADLTAHWLAIRATTVSAEQACLDLERFLNQSDFPYVVRIAVSGIFIEKDMQFGEGLWLRTDRQEHLPKALHPNEFLSRSLLHMPMVALIEERVQKIQRRPAEERDKSELRQPPLESDDVLLCLSLVRPPATPFIVGLVCEPAKWVPMYGFLDVPRTLESSGHQTRLWRDHTQRAQMMYDAFRVLPPRRKARLRLPMSRLNTAMRRREDADTAIDLGIALEGLVIGSSETDKRYQAAVRCAFLLGNDVESRHRAYHLAGELYHLRNRAVHRGVITQDDLTPHFKGKEVRRVLEEGASLVATVITRLIENNAQEPDWNSLVLGEYTKPLTSQGEPEPGV